MKKACCAAMGLLLVAVGCRVPPEDELESAQKQVEAARRSEAGRYAPEMMRDAEQLLGDASLKVSEKSYEEARSLAEQARTKAAAAEKAASENLQVLRQRSAAFQASAGRRLSDLKNRMESLSKIREAVRTRLQDAAHEIETLVLQHAERVREEHFTDLQELESTMEERLQRLVSEISDIENGAVPEKSKEAGKKKP
jgi:predicted S18 family serine protease